MPAPADPIIQGLQNLQPHYIFNGLPASVDTVSPYCLMIAGTILLVGHVAASSEARRSNAKQEDVWMKTILVAAFMFTSSFWITGAATAGDEIADHTGLGSPLAVTSRCIIVATSLPELTNFMEPKLLAGGGGGGAAPGLFDPGAAVNAANDGSTWGYVKATFAALGEEFQWAGQAAKDLALNVVNVATLLGTFLSVLLKCIVMVPALLVLLVALLIAAGIAWFMEAVRYFLLVTGAVLLPAAVACYRTKALGNQGHNYVMSMVSICMWPVGWALGHAGTVGLFNAWVSTMSGTNIWGQWANSMTWDHIMTDGITWKTGANALATGGQMWAMWANFPAYFVISFVVGGVGLCVWIFVVTIGAPVLVHKLVTAGAAFYSGAASQTGQQVGRAVEQAGKAIQQAGVATGNPAVAAAGGAISGAGGGFAAVASGAGGASDVFGGMAGGYWGGREQAIAQQRQMRENDLTQSIDSRLQQIVDALATR